MGVMVEAIHTGIQSLIQVNQQKWYTFIIRLIWMQSCRNFSLRGCVEYLTNIQSLQSPLFPFVFLSCYFDSSSEPLGYLC
jgi:hypothetical protein